MDGICTLANDVVYDQLIALLNSIEVNLGVNIPVCVYPYDDNIALIKQEIAKRPYVELFDHQDIINPWDNFARSVWDIHPTANQLWQKLNKQPYHRFGTHRRYCAFDAPFERFLYMDADTLLMGDIKKIFTKLDDYDGVVYDFQYKDPCHVYNLHSQKLLKIFTQQQIESSIFCSGFYAGHQGLFNHQQREFILAQLLTEAEILYPMAVDQSLVNYMMMRSNYNVYNFALNLPPQSLTGCCVTSLHFQNQDYVLYDKGTRLTYLHYIGLPCSLFSRVCAGENLDFPYRDLFLHYRYLHEPEKRPQFIGKPQPYYQKASLGKRIFKKLGLKV